MSYSLLSKDGFLSRYGDILVGFFAIASMGVVLGVGITQVITINSAGDVFESVNQAVNLFNGKVITTNSSTADLFNALHALNFQMNINMKVLSDAQATAVTVNGTTSSGVSSFFASVADASSTVGAVAQTTLSAQAALSSSMGVYNTQYLSASSSIKSYVKDVVWHMVIGAGGGNIGGRNQNWYGFNQQFGSYDPNENARATVNPRVWQWPANVDAGLYPGRLGEAIIDFTGVAMPAVEPLRNPDSLSQKGEGPLVSYCIQESYKYPSNHRWMIVPSGYVNSTLAFTGNPPTSPQWRPGYSLYESTIARANSIARQISPVETVIIWSQGEADASLSVDAQSYQSALDALVKDFRARITGALNAPFVVLSMVPDWVSYTSSSYLSAVGMPAASPSVTLSAVGIDAVQRDLPRRVARTAYVRGGRSCAEAYGYAYYSANCNYENGIKLSDSGLASANANVALSVPYAISNLTVASITSTSFCLYWNESSTVVRVADYAVYLQSGAGAFTLLVHDPNASNRTTCVTSATSRTAYVARVCPANDFGQGPCTDTASFSTLDPAQPTGLNVIESRTDSLVLTWNDPVTPTTYSIGYSLAGSGLFSIVTGISPAGNKPYTLTGLTPGVRYDVSVSIATSAGTSPPSIYYNIDTDASIGLPLQVMQFRADRGVVADKDGFVTRWVDQTIGANDMFPKSYTGTPYAPPHVTTHQGVRVVRFSSSSSMMGTPTGFPLAGAYTQLWVGVFDTLGQYGRIVSSYIGNTDNHVIERRGRNNLYTWSDNSQIAFGAKYIVTRSFYAIAAVCGGNTITLYRNGIQDGASKTVTSCAGGDASLALNSWSSAANYAIGGEVRVLEVAVWATALTSAQLLSESSRLVSYYNVSFSTY
jgi:hypothetical protein